MNLKHLSQFGLLSSFILISSPSIATDVGVVGLLPGKAILIVDGSPPKMFTAGSAITPEIKLLEASRDGAVISEKGVRHTLQIGSHYGVMASPPANKVVLEAQEGGHFFANVRVNNQSETRMLVDTGASTIALPAELARRWGIEYLQGVKGQNLTANGPVTVYRIKLASVKIGSMELNQIDASIHEDGLPIPLLGMSFLNRLDMQRKGQQMTLSKH